MMSVMMMIIICYRLTGTFKSNQCRNNSLCWSCNSNTIPTNIEVHLLVHLVSLAISVCNIWQTLLLYLQVPQGSRAYMSHFSLRGSEGCKEPPIMCPSRGHADTSRVHFNGASGVLPYMTVRQLLKNISLLVALCL